VVLWQLLRSCTNGIGNNGGHDALLLEFLHGIGIRHGPLLSSETAFPAAAPFLV
jgi:hypothetical protein